MNRKFTRRRFARLALVGGVAVGSMAVVSAPMAGTILARPASLTLVGVTAGPLLARDPVAPDVDATEFESLAGGAVTQSLAAPIVLNAINLMTGQREFLQVPQALQDGRTPVLRSNEALSGCALLPDGTLVVAITPVAGSRNEVESTRLTRLGTVATTVAVAGLGKGEQLGQLMTGPDGSLSGVVTRRNGVGPARLVGIDLSTGRLSGGDPIQVPEGWRLNAMALSPDGQLCATATGRQGETSLVRPGSRGSRSTLLAPLTVGDTAWNNGLQSLAYTPAGQLVALGALRGEAPNALYGVDMRSGAMSKLYDVDVARIAIGRA